MDAILPVDRSTLVEFFPPESRPVSATVRLINAAGVELATPSVTVDTLSRTVASVSDADTVSVSGATGTHAAGRSYWWTAASDSTLTAMVMLSDVEGNIWYLERAAPTEMMVAGDTLRGARLTATFLSSVVTARGENHRIEWTVTGADGVVRTFDQVAHVTRKNIRPAVDSVSARDFVSTAWPDIARRNRYGYFARLASLASERVWRRIRRTGRFVHLLADSDDFAAAGRIALERELAGVNLVPAGVLDVVAYRRQLDEQLDAEIEDVVSSRPYDENDDDALDDTETSTVNAIRLVRR